MRPGIPHLFDLFRKSNFAVGAFSEAHTVFEGLDFAPYIHPLPNKPKESLQRLDQHLTTYRQQSSFLFIHYWSTHTPYGAADNRAFGETSQLLFGLGKNIVLERYKSAITHLLEYKLTPIINHLDLSNWCVIILSDHGESWTEEEPYHGQTLRNAVLRIPLYLHIPHTGNPPLTQPILSLIDLFPTIAASFQLQVDYRGFGRDLFTASANTPYLAEIQPLPTHNDLKAMGIQSSEGKKWALFNEREKYTFDESIQRGWLEETMSEKVIREKRTEFKDIYSRMQQQSPYSSGKIHHRDPPQNNALLEKRLEQLGYL